MIISPKCFLQMGGRRQLSAKRFSIIAIKDYSKINVTMMYNNHTMKQQANISTGNSPLPWDIYITDGITRIGSSGRTYLHDKDSKVKLVGVAVMNKGPFTSSVSVNAVTTLP